MFQLPKKIQNNSLSTRTSRKRLIFSVTLGALISSVQICAEPLSISPDQSTQLGIMDVEGTSHASIEFTGKRDEVFVLPLVADQMNWEGKQSLVLKLFNPAETDGHLIVFIRNALDEKPLRSFPRLYHWAMLPLDWVGWREVEIPFWDFKPSTGQIELGDREVPAEVTQIWFGNQIGPDDPMENTWGVPTAVDFQLGMESITVKD